MSRQFVNGRFYCSECSNEIATYDALVQQHESGVILCGQCKVKIAKKVEETELQKVLRSQVVPDVKILKAIFKATSAKKEGKNEEAVLMDESDRIATDSSNSDCNV